MPLDPLLGWIEGTTLSTWVRESPSILAFQGVLVLHTLGMGFAVGASAAIALRLLGVANRVPVSALAKFYPVFWVGLALNAFSGLLLLIAYPTKALTNPMFYFKLLCIALAVWAMQVIRRRLDSPEPKLLASLTLLFWIGAIAAGRLLAYTYSRLLVDFGERF